MKHFFACGSFCSSHKTRNSSLIISMIMCQATTLHQANTPREFNDLQTTLVLKRETNDSGSITLVQTFIGPKSFDLMRGPSKHVCDFPVISWDGDDSDNTFELASFSLIGSKRRKTNSNGMVRSKAVHGNLDSLRHSYSIVRTTLAL